MCRSYGANASFRVGAINMSPLTGLFRSAVASPRSNALFGSPADGRDPSPRYSSSLVIACPSIALPL
jgi:hypothetical protein